MIGADTSFFIDFLNGDEKAVNFMKKNKQNITTCELVAFEFLCGNLTQEEKEKFLAFITRFQSFNTNRASILKASDIYRKGKRKGKIVPQPDSLIAGTYLANGISKIVSKNKKHFEKIKEVTALSY